MTIGKRSFAANAWIVSGVLIAVTLGLYVVREIPAMRREWRIMRM